VTHSEVNKKVSEDILLDKESLGEVFGKEEKRYTAGQGLYPKILVLFGI
jgi:hypothetical protein